MKKSIDLVMFDLDGTLADTGHDLAQSVNFTRAHFQLSPLPDKLVYANVGRGVEHLLKQSLPDQAPRHFDEVMGVFLAHYEAHLLDRTVLYPGVREVLRYFRGKRRLVVSNKMHRLTLAVVRGLGVAGELDAILGGDSAAENKPHQALLHWALEKFQIPAKSAVMFGDGET
ncbi:MAG: HAD family hydrolase, partial [Candidatus Binatia bacterium]